jgi:peptidoglycan hydrolase-like protein with peptidoglycan-binding domain
MGVRSRRTRLAAVTVGALTAITLALGTSPASVNGNFGTGTKAAHKSWQKTRSLTTDGSVGENTFAAADASLTFDGGSTADGQYLYMRYNDTIEFTRNTNGD